MFKRIRSIDNPVRLHFEGEMLTAQEGDTVAAALLSCGIIAFRQSAEEKSDRGPYCLIGNCFDCLVEIDGIPNRQACREPVYEGMRIERQIGLTRLGVDDES
ncbi:MAG: putative molibdopterin-dependent oxidoreductase YjgC [Gammaproteobacteria bacterium]|jgi:predicted molibdopterin-dependent oxidoreductase YjgC